MERTRRSTEHRAPPSVSSCLEHLEQAISAARELGLDSSAARTVRDLARERLRFPASTYVLALAGGTGVGKSSLLNALARTEVSPSGVRRPTTGVPVAWVHRSARAELEPLLDWLELREVREHDDEGGARVALVDLPDLDSIAPAHRARVDQLLPRIDAVAWVADPEKYQDALFHDAYLREWGPRVARQAVIVNKTDRVAPADGERLRHDLERRLRLEGLGDVPVMLSSTLDGHGTGVDEVRRWLESAADAKLVVAERVAAEARAEVRSLTTAAGVPAALPVPPLVDDQQRERVARAVGREVLAILDLPGLELQAAAASRAAARSAGGGPLGFVTRRMSRWSGREARTADPAAHLRTWRHRGSLARATEPLRQLLAGTLSRLPPAGRPVVAALGDSTRLQPGLATAVDRAIAGEPQSFVPPSSHVWTVLGLGQYVATALIAFGLLWLLAQWVSGGSVPVGSAELPYLGEVPQPVLLLAAGLLASFVLGRLLALHARWLGRRWAGRLRDRVVSEVEQRIATTLFAPLDALEEARTRLASAAAEMERGCLEPGVDGR